MEISPKNYAQLNSIQKEIVFNQDTYKFRGSQSKGNEFSKTCIKRKFSQDQINRITKIYHKNMIGLKKIGKSKKSSQQQVFWLYYENVPYSLEQLLALTQIDITPQQLQSVLLQLKNYLIPLRIQPQFNQLNIGVSQNGMIKIYIPAQNILRAFVTQKKFQFIDIKIKQIKLWYSALYSRKSLRPNQIPKTISDKKLTESKLNKYVEIKYDFQKIRKKIRSQQSKNNSVIGSPNNQQKKVKNINIQGEPHNIIINVYNQKISKGNQLDKQLKVSHSKQKSNAQYIKNLHHLGNNLNIVRNNIRHTPKYQQYEYDGESVDTYQMEMGEDFQMPTMRANQKLRQTVLNSKKSWDTLTHKSPSNIQTIKNNKIHESAGRKDFMAILQRNRNIINQDLQFKYQQTSDNRTVQDDRLKSKNWQSSTIKSAFPPNIQDRVQQALTKAKYVMLMLKNTKSFSAGK